VTDELGRSRGELTSNFAGGTKENHENSAVMTVAVLSEPTDRLIESKKNAGIIKPQDDVTSLKSRRIRWAGHVARMREKRNAYRILV
jgi:hypothetical protein